MKRTIVLGGALLFSLAASAQTPFQNLDFEAATFPGIPPDPMYGRYDISNAMPGWTAYVGTRPEHLILHDNFFLDSAGIGVLDPACVDPFGWCRVLSGQYTAWLQAGHDIPSGGPYAVSLAQTGLIPDGTRTVAFMSIGVQSSDPAPYLRVSVAGLETPLYLLSSQPTFNIYGVDVSAYAGQQAELKFTTDGRLYLDAIRFTATLVPEPNPVNLGITALAIIALSRFRKHGIWGRKTTELSGLGPAAIEHFRGAASRSGESPRRFSSRPMKRFMLVTGLLTSAWGTASGQGIVASHNSSTSLITNYWTRMPVPVGTMLQVAIYYLPDQATTPTLRDFDARGIMLGPAVNIGPAAGLYLTGTRSTPSTTEPGGTAWFQVRAWEAAFGATYEEVWNNSTPIGGRLGLTYASDVMRVRTGDPTSTPMGVPGLVLPSQFSMTTYTPEPSALGLTLLGGGVVCVVCRRASRRGPPCDQK